MEKEVLENHKRYLERKEIYRKFGFDIDRERGLVLNKAEPVFGDILEIGTGKGHFTLILAEEGYQFTSIDISGKEQEFARLNLKYFDLEEFVDFKVENAEKLSFKDDSFDVILSVNTFHHFTDPFKVMDELVRVLSFEGKIILSDFNKAGLELLDKIHASEHKVHEKSRFSLNNIEVYMRQKHFKIEKSNTSFQKILTFYKPII